MIEAFLRGDSRGRFILNKAHEDRVRNNQKINKKTLRGSQEDIMKISTLERFFSVLAVKIASAAVLGVGFGFVFHSVEALAEPPTKITDKDKAADSESLSPAKSSQEGSTFFRFVDLGQNKGRLQTAITHYTNEEGVAVSLIGVVHIGDAKYYKNLQAIFKDYDALLYEMVKPADDSSAPGKQTTSSVSSIQRGMKRLLELEFQLDALDYDQENFVHADMDVDTFFRVQDERGESMLSLMFQSMMQQWSQQMKGKGPRMNHFQLLAALLNPDRARALKYLLAQEMEAIESMVAGLDGSDGGKGSVILTERNKVAFEVLEREIKDGKLKLGVFYGAAHLPDMERRLFDMGYHLKSTDWLTAWDIR